MGNHRWGADQNIQFINEYQRHECLWDPKHPQYKNKLAREAAYKTMMQATEMESMVDVVSKIRILRNTYNNEILKAKKSMEMADKLYVSKIPWLNHLDFIKNIESDRTENSATDNTLQTSTAESKIKKCTIRPKPASAPTPKNKRKLGDPLIRDDGVLEKVSTPKANARSNDEFDLFGQTIAEQLRQLPLGIALETEEMLLATVRKQRMRVADDEARRRNKVQEEIVCKDEIEDDKEDWET
ncbi:hypothetical protein ABMA28_005059 [Loxostege sticticalis]|uniref:MADF domain-containing protein n=1 Tax=Loxostege sticticalis TaxID=481309 RepID=A0ABD0SRK1_LOXSC